MLNEEPKTENKKIQFNSYVKYSSISFQMLATILVFAFSGKAIDNYMSLEKPFFSAILSIVGVGIALYLAIKKISQ